MIPARRPHALFRYHFLQSGENLDHRRIWSLAIAQHTQLKRLCPPEPLESTAEPVLTLALAAVVLGERLSVIQVMGAALVIGALLAAQFGRARRA